MPCPSQFSRFNHPGYFRSTIQTMKFLSLLESPCEPMELVRSYLFSTMYTPEEKVSPLVLFLTKFNPVPHIATYLFKTFKGADCLEDISMTSCTQNTHYRESKIRRNLFTTNPMQGQVRCCQIWGRRRKREDNHMSGP